MRNQSFVNGFVFALFTNYVLTNVLQTPRKKENDLAQFAMS